MKVLFIAFIFFIFGSCKDITNNTAKNEGVKSYGTRTVVKTDNYIIDIINIDGKLYLVGSCSDVNGRAITIIPK